MLRIINEFKINYYVSAIDITLSPLDSAKDMRTETVF